MMIGELLVKKGLITQEQLDMALEEQKIISDFLGAILIRKNFIKESDLLGALSTQYNIPHVELRLDAIDWNAAMRFNLDLVVEHSCLPIREDDNMLWIAITNPLDAHAISESERLARPKGVHLVLISSKEMEKALQIYKEKMAYRLKKSLE